MKHYTVDLDHRLAIQETVTGGKGASLARLRRLGARVPPGFVVTTAVFRQALEEYGLLEAQTRKAWTRQELEQVQERLLHSDVPHSLARRIERAYQRLGGQVAVRSSMVGEDSARSSFAGQLDTFLNVEGQEALIEAIKRCWASAFSEQLYQYLRTRQDPEQPPLSLAVVVQRMVNARAAGVAFSADPLTGENHVIVEAAPGLGDALVQGRVDPDRYIVNARRQLVQATLAGERAPALPEAQVLDLAALVCDLACQLRAPQDIEWAWDGELYVLQSRPITSLSGRSVYSNSMVSEMLPGLIKPLVWSVSVKSKLENVLGRIFGELIGPNEFDFAQLAECFHSRIYADNTMLGQVLEQMGMPANLFEVMSHDERASRQRLPVNLQMIRTMGRMTRFVWRNARVDQEISAYIARHDRALEPYRRADWESDQDEETLLRHADHLIDLYSETLWYNFVGPIHMMIRKRGLDRLVERRAPDVAPGDLIRGLVGLKSLESNQALVTLAEQASALGDEIRELLLAGQDAPIRAALSASPQGEALLHQVDRFLERYGFLSANGTDFSRTPWVEDPKCIWQAIGQGMGRPAPQRTKEAIQGVHEIRKQAHARVRAQLGLAQRFVFDRLMASTLAYIDLRERSSFVISEESFQMRRIFVALGRRLVARGELDRPKDVFYLDLNELRQLAAGTLRADAQEGSARDKVAARRAAMEADARLELPDTFCGKNPPICPPPLTEGTEVLTGISGSSGMARGYARVVSDPSQAPVTLNQDDILVVPFTDASWTPLFFRIGGLVAETGGQLSHSAIIAREYGLPAVVNVKHATRLIPDGQPIVVDGTRGRVYRQDREEAEI